MRRADSHGLHCRGAGALLMAGALLSLLLTAHVLQRDALYGGRYSHVSVYDTADYSDAANSLTPAAPSSSSSVASPSSATSTSSASQDDGPDIAVAAALANSAASPPGPARRLPRCLIIGVRKCGTRALLEMLFLHPAVQKASGEVHFFDRDDNYGRGLEWYRSRMPPSLPHQVTIEKSPSYFVTPEVPERIRAMNSSVKLLLIVREPVTRAISDYTQLRTHATTPAATSSGAPSGAPSAAPSGAPAATASQPTQAPRAFEELVVRPDGSVNVNYRPLSTSLYHTYLHRWLEVFPREQLLVVNGDLLIEDPVPELRRIEQFLGLPPRIGRHNFYFNQTKGFYCLRNETEDRCLHETKGRRHPRVDAGVIAKLRRFFREPNQRFYELVGQDLGWPEE